MTEDYEDREFRVVLTVPAGASVYPDAIAQAIYRGSGSDVLSTLDAVLVEETRHDPATRTYLVRVTGPEPLTRDDPDAPDTLDAAMLDVEDMLNRVVPEDFHVRIEEG